MLGRVVSVNVSDGGVPKLPVPQARVTKLGLLGDRQKHTKFHGGPERAVCLYSLEVIERLKSQGHPIVAGGAGENLTVSGLDWAGIVPHTVLRIGKVVTLEITKHAKPCATIRGCFSDGDSERISPKLYPTEARLYARVLAEGEIRPGDPVEVLPPRSAIARRASKLFG